MFFVAHITCLNFGMSLLLQFSSLSLSCKYIWANLLFSKGWSKATCLAFWLSFQRTVHGAGISFFQVHLPSIIIFLFFSHALISTASHSEGRYAHTMILTKAYCFFKLSYSISIQIVLLPTQQLTKEKRKLFRSFSYLREYSCPCRIC